MTILGLCARIRQYRDY